jgi:hypothetical protein
MKRDKWATHLATFKRNEKPETVLMLAGSAELTRIAVAWSGTSVERKKRLCPCRKEDVQYLWQWLWDNTDYCKAQFLSRLPISTEKADRMFESLVANRILYPDGTVNSFVQRYLQQRVLSLFKVRRSSQNRAGTD